MKENRNTNKREEAPLRTERQHTTEDVQISKTGTPLTQRDARDISEIDMHEGNMHNGALGGNFNEEVENDNRGNERNK